MKKIIAFDTLRFILALCVVVAYVCYHAQKWLFGKLKAVFLIENGGMGK